MIRVLRVIARLNVGGPARQVAALQSLLPAHGVESILAVGDVGPDEADMRECVDFEGDLRRIPHLGRAPHPARDLAALAALASVTRELRPDIIHTHTFKAGLLGRLAAEAARVPLRVHTFHGHLLHGYYGRPATAALRQLEGTLARRTTALLAVGEAVRDQLLAAGIGKLAQYEIVPPGIALPRVAASDEARTELNIPTDAPTVAFVARLTRVKRPDRFVDAFARVSQRLPQSVGLVCGAGELEVEVRRRAEGAGEIRFLGWRRDIETVLAAADVVVLTSDNEGMPVSLIEAALAARPAVTTNVGSAREVVVDGETGYVVARDPRAIADAVCSLLMDRPHAARIGAAAARRALRIYSADRLASQTADIYQRLVKLPRCAGVAG